MSIAVESFPSCPGLSAGWPGCSGPIRNGLIISLSSCSTMWQCHTYWPGPVNRALFG